MPARSPRWPHDGVFVRIARSGIHGIGVRAIRDIPAGTTLFRADRARVVWVPGAVVRRLPEELRQMYDDFAMRWGDRYGVPRHLDLLNVGWYINHSETPNVEPDEESYFHSLRAIRKGEELTADYRTFWRGGLMFQPRANPRGGPRRPGRAARTRPASASRRDG
jgi:hypothetical protein